MRKWLWLHSFIIVATFSCVYVSEVEGDGKKCSNYTAYSGGWEKEAIRFKLVCNDKYGLVMQIFYRNPASEASGVYETTEIIAKDDRLILKVIDSSSGPAANHHFFHLSLLGDSSLLLKTTLEKGEQKHVLSRASL